MEKITPNQLKKLHILFSELKIDEDMKDEIIRQTSRGRTTSSKELYKHEAKNLIVLMVEDSPSNKMIKKVFALAYKAGIIYGDTPEDKKMNTAKLNMFLREKGAVKKDISKMNKTELLRVVNQFEQIVKHKDESKAAQTTKNLLSELNISTSK